jgi:hypothetical protein
VMTVSVSPRVSDNSVWMMIPPLLTKSSKQTLHPRILRSVKSSI